MAKDISAIIKQPINGHIDSIKAAFESEYRVDPFDQSQLKSVFGNEQTAEEYIGLLLSSVSEESEKVRIGDTIKRSMRAYSSVSTADLFRSEEGLDHTTGPASNVGALDAFNPATILGYNAKAYMLDVYKPINHDKREFAIQFELAYAISSDSVNLADRKFLPQSIRDGSISGMLNPQTVTLLINGVAGSTHVTTIGGVGFAKLGVKGNTITESGKDIRDWALAEDIRVDSITYDTSVAGDGSTTGVMFVGARSEVKGYGGDSVAQRMVSVEANLPLVGGSLVDDYFTVYVNRDTGEYRSTGSATGRILGFSFNIPLLNPTNAAATVRHGRDVITARVIAKPRTPMSVGLAMDTVMDEFVSVAAGNADIVKYVSNEFSTILAGVNDVDMEKHMISNIENCLSNPAILETYVAAPRLGGYAASMGMDLTQRGIGGDRPLSWIEEGVKDTLSTMLIMGETDTQFTADADREWVVAGYQRDVKRFVDTKYFTESEAGSVEGDTRFGFKKMNTFAYTDSFGQRVKFIGITDKRWQDRNGAVYGFLRSNTPKVQPTGVYHGYDFRIVKARDARQLGIDSIQYWIHDCWEILALCAVKIQLTNPVNLYKGIVANQTLTVNQVTTPPAAPDYASTDYAGVHSVSEGGPSSNSQYRY